MVIILFCLGWLYFVSNACLVHCVWEFAHDEFYDEIDHFGKFLLLLLICLVVLFIGLPLFIVLSFIIHIFAK